MGFEDAQARLARERAETADIYSALGRLSPGQILRPAIAPLDDDEPARQFPEVVSNAISAFVREHGRYPSDPEIRAWAESVGVGPTRHRTRPVVRHAYLVSIFNRDEIERRLPHAEIRVKPGHLEVVVPAGDRVANALLESYAVPGTMQGEDVDGRPLDG